MKRSLFRDWICPIGLCCGTVGLIALIVFSFFDGYWRAGVIIIVCWLYGAAFVSDIIPFFKRVFAKKVD